jgi:hypothetical protein
MPEGLNRDTSKNNNTCKNITIMQVRAFIPAYGFHLTAKHFVPKLTAFYSLTFPTFNGLRDRAVRKITRSFGVCRSVPQEWATEAVFQTPASWKTDTPDALVNKL